MKIDEQGRHEPDHSGTPVDLVMGFHRFLRETLIWKRSGLTEEQLRWSPVDSGISLLSIMKHSINVERFWIAGGIGGIEVTLDWSTEDPDGEWKLKPTDTLESLTAEFLAEASRTEQVLADIGWDDVPKHPRNIERGYNVGWILTHMVEEVGRHCGHADLIREMIDGQVGE